MNWKFTKHQAVRTETHAISLGYLYILTLINLTINREAALRWSDIQGLGDNLGKDLPVTFLRRVLSNDTQTYTNIRLTMYNNYSKLLLIYYLFKDKSNFLKGNP
jgi:hypothetical protein